LNGTKFMYKHKCPALVIPTAMVCYRKPKGRISYRSRAT